RLAPAVPGNETLFWVTIMSRPDGDLLAAKLCEITWINRIVVNFKGVLVNFFHRVYVITSRDPGTIGGVRDRVPGEDHIIGSHRCSVLPMDIVTHFPNDRHRAF